MFLVVVDVLHWFYTLLTMRMDRKLAHLLSDFCLDMAKAVAIGTFITPSLSGMTSTSELVSLLTRGVASATMFLGFAWYLAKREERER